MRARLALTLLILGALAVAPAPARPHSPLRVTFHPAALTVGDVGWVHVRGASESATMEGSVGERSLTFFPHAGGHVALIGIDLEVRPGTQPWRIAVLESGREPEAARGSIRVRSREFRVQRLTVPESMVVLDPETERRAVSESDRLRTVCHTLTAERLWRGPFVRPVAGDAPGTGFGARRIINGRPRMPHSGIDYAAPIGTPVVAANSGRVALVGDFFFPGRLVVLDHGLGLHTLYFHLDTVGVIQGETVDRGQPIGTVGTTGRSTGPHLHFGAQVGPARIDPAVLLQLSFRD